MKNNYLFIFIKSALFWSVLPYELQENLAKSDQQSLYYSVPLKFRFNSMQLTLPNTKKVNLDPPSSICVDSDYFFLNLLPTFCYIEMLIFLKCSILSYFWWQLFVIIVFKVKKIVLVINWPYVSYILRFSHL